MDESLHPMTDIAPLIKRSLVDQALEQLRWRITEGKWAIGERLPTEPELSAELGISRNTVREAMRVLAFSGLIEIRQGDGSYVRSALDAAATLGSIRKSRKRSALAGFGASLGIAATSIQSSEPSLGTA